jgi:hypothetical protein
MRSERFCGLCGLTAAEIDLMWQTAPPRMPSRRQKHDQSGPKPKGQTTRK